MGKFVDCEMVGEAGVSPVEVDLGCVMGYEQDVAKFYGGGCVCEEEELCGDVGLNVGDYDLVAGAGVVTFDNGCFHWLVR